MGKFTVSFAPRGRRRGAGLLLLALAATVPLLAAGCARGRAEDKQSVVRAPDLRGTKWVVVELRGAAVDSSTLPEAPWLKLDPQQDRVTGFGGCNRFFGQFDVAGEGLTVGPLAMTRRFCREGSDVEQSLSEALRQVAGWKIFAGQLVLSNGPVVLLRAEAAPEAPASEKPAEPAAATKP